MHVDPVSIISLFLTTRKPEKRGCFASTLDLYLGMDSSVYTYVGSVNQNLVFLFSYYHIPYSDELFLDLLHL